MEPITDNFPAASAVPYSNGMPRPAPAERARICRPWENELIARETQEIRDAQSSSVRKARTSFAERLLVTSPIESRAWSKRALFRKSANARCKVFTALPSHRHSQSQPGRDDGTSGREPPPPEPRSNQRLDIASDVGPLREKLNRNSPMSFLCDPSSPAVADRSPLSLGMPEQRHALAACSNAWMSSSDQRSTCLEK